MKALNNECARDAVNFIYKHGDLTYGSAYDAIQLLTSNGFAIYRTDGDEQVVYTDPDGKVWHPHRGYWCWKVSSELAQAQERIKELEAQLAERRTVADAIAYVQKRLDDYVNEHGSTDPETGTVEFPGNGDEYVGELEEIIDGLSTLEITPPAPKVTEGLAALMKAAVDRYEALPPEERAAHDHAQRESFLRGLSPCEHGDRDWETCPHCHAASREID